jgi:hypothetical protein
MNAWLNLRHSVPERQAAFRKGLERLGFTVREGVTTRPGGRDILVTWNRIREGGTAATAFESRGRPVLVTENASWGNDFAGDRWYTLARQAHNTSGRFPVGSPGRWDSLRVELAPWRAGGETVLLPQRGIGQVGQMPHDWPARAQKRYGGRMRPHPGTNKCAPLEQDLCNAGRVVTWGSGAAIKALLWGIPVVSEKPEWIGEQDNTDEGRLDMFRRLAWAQWRLREIESGAPFDRLLR